MTYRTLLKEVWDKCSFEDILNAGLENYKITSSDIIHASDIYDDPEKEYSDEDIKEMISSRGLREVMEIIQEEYSLCDILDDLPKNEILDNIDANERLDSLENTWELEQHDEEIKHECINEWIDEFNKEKEEQSKNMFNWSPDELHKLLCDGFGYGYYDNNISDRIKEILNKNTYNVKYA